MKRARLFNAVYRLLSPIIGNRPAIWLAELTPAFLFAGIPLLLFWLFLSGPTTDRGRDHQTCGSGPWTWDC